MSGGDRGVPFFENAVVVRGRLVDRPEVIPGDSLQVRFVLAWPVRPQKAYFFEVNLFNNAGLAQWALEGDRRSIRLDRGDEVLIQGTLASYNKPVKGVKGNISVTRVCINAKDITRTKLGSRRTDQEAAAEPAAELP